MYVLGVDFGGGACKTTLINKYGKTVATATAEYPTFYGDNGMAEQNPMDWYNAACKNIKAVINGINPDDIKCICFDAATHTAVLMDDNGIPVCNSVYWTDTRSLKEKEYLKQNYGKKLFEKCKHKVDTIWSLPEIMYVKNNFPDTYKKVKKITFAKDFVRGLFTGDFVTDYVEAQGSMLFDFDKHVWDSELLGLIGMTEENMPKIVTPLDCVGKISEEQAKLTGLSENTAVICGATDTAMEVFAGGGIKEGDTTIKLATAGRICVVSSKYYPDKNVINYSHIKSGLYYPGSATKSCASSLRWFRDVFGGSFEEFSLMAENISVGCDGLIFHPYLMGELTPFANPDLRGSFIGVGANHTKAHFARAVMEGVAMSLRDCKEYLEQKGITIEGDVFIIGGGAKSKVWRQIVADVLNVKLISTKNNDSSFGSAMCAGIHAGFFKNFDEALSSCKEVVGETLPIKENVEVYSKTYKKYKKISSFLNELSNEK